MQVECPCFNSTIDRNVARITNFLAMLLLLAGLFSMLKWIALFLCFDCLIRGFTHLPISPLHRAAKAQAKLMGLRSKMTNAGPRIYDARIWFFLTAIITILSFAGFNAAARTMTELLILVAGLAAFFGICIGCYTHTLLKKINAWLCRKSG